MKSEPWYKKDLLPGLNLRKKFPGYFNMWIIRGMWVILLVLVVAEYQSNNGSFSSIYVECKDPKGCLNPFYECPPEYNDIQKQYMLPGKICTTERIFCENDMCKKERLEYGEKYGRKGLGWEAVLVLLLSGFSLNHLVYLWSKKHERKNNI
jgi:hypothetical protein